MACCTLENCSQFPEYILWEYDYQTYCEKHILSSTERQIYNLKECSIDYLGQFILYKYQKICGQLFEMFENSTKILQAKKEEIDKSILLINGMKAEYTKVFQKIFDSTPIESKPLIDATINNFVFIEKNISSKPLTEFEYINSEIERLKENFLEIDKYRSQFVSLDDKKKITLSQTMTETTKYFESVVPEDLKNQKVVYINSKTNIELWKVETIDNKQYYMKRLEYFDERSKKKLVDEIELLNTHKHTKVFAPVVSKGDDGKFVWYYKRIFKQNLSKLLKSHRFSEKEIWNFVNLITQYVNMCSGKLRSYILEPKCIAYSDGVFIIQDILYMNLEQIEKYMSPEIKNKDTSVGASSLVIYSAGMIILEMLLVDIDGFNKANFYSILIDRIKGITGISDLLKELVSHMVHYDVSLRINKETIYKYKPNEI